MEVNELTIEQALANIKIVLDKFIGTKQDHIILDQSIQLIEKELSKING